MRHFKLWAGCDSSKNNIFTPAEKEIPSMHVAHREHNHDAFDMIFKSKIERWKRNKYSILPQFYGDITNHSIVKITFIIELTELHRLNFFLNTKLCFSIILIYRLLFSKKSSVAQLRGSAPWLRCRQINESATYSCKLNLELKVNSSQYYKHLQWFMFLKCSFSSFFIFSVIKFSKTAYLWSRRCWRLRRKSGKIQMAEKANIIIKMMLIKCYWI